jgi:hypothetical protein
MTLAVIATFHRRWDRWPALLERVMVESTRIPDEFFVMCEDELDAEHLHATDPRMVVQILPTPVEDGKYTEIPYSRKINWALDRTSAEYIVYLTDDSEPHADKFRLMAAALDDHPEWGAVFCLQNYAGGVRGPHGPVGDAYGVLDHTQVMHRLTADRWPTNIRDIRMGDGVFWRTLHATVGEFHPVPEVLDTVQQTADGISASW